MYQSMDNALRELIRPESENALRLYESLQFVLLQLANQIAKTIEKTLDRESWLAEMKTILGFVDAAAKKAHLASQELQRISLNLMAHEKVAVQAAKAAQDSAIGHAAYERP
jgi:hypothetical protein